MISVMTAAESARDLLATVTHPVSYAELASHLARDYSGELFDALSGLVRSHVDELSGPELSNLLWAYATVPHDDRGLVAAIVQSLGQPTKLGDLSTGDLANTLWALARFGVYDPQIVAAASERVWDGLPSATPRQLAAILQAYAIFRERDPQLEDDDDLLRSIAARFRATLPDASPSEVALAMSSLARLRRADSALLDDACAAVRRAAPAASLDALADAAWACAALQHRDLAMLEAVAERVLGALRVAAGLAPAPPGVAASVSASLPLPLRPAAAAAGARGGGSSSSGGGSGVAAAYAPRASASAARGHGASSAQRPNPGFAAASLWPSAAAAERAPLYYSALHPTHQGPGGHAGSCSLSERFNPALPDSWQWAPASGEAAGFQGPAACEAVGVTSAVGDAAAAGGAGASLRALADPAMAAADAEALVDADVVSKLLWSYCTLHCYSESLFSLLFRQLPRLHHNRSSWSALARLMSAQVKTLELQRAPGPCRINPLEAESVTAWGRFMRTRSSQLKLPAHFLPAAFVAYQAETAGRDALDAARFEAAPDPQQPQPPGLVLSRAALEAEVAAALRAIGLPLRPSATIDGFFKLDNTILINGLTICVEVLSAACCTLDAPHRPMGPAASRLRSLEFRGWTPLVVPFHEWAALAPEEGPATLAQHAEPGGAAKRAAALQEASAARQRYLRVKLEELLGEALPPINQIRAIKRRA